MTTGIEFVVGDATQPVGPGMKYIVHCCNDVGAWGAGFVLALSKRWPVTEAEYRRKGGWQRWALGEVQFVNVEDDIVVCNLIGQHDVRHGPRQRPPIRYDALYDGMTFMTEYLTTNYEIGDASVHMPLIGSGLAGGRWSIIKAIIEETFIEAGIPTFVYELPPITS